MFSDSFLVTSTCLWICLFLAYSNSFGFVFWFTVWNLSFLRVESIYQSYGHTLSTSSLILFDLYNKVIPHFLPSTLIVNNVSYQAK